MSRVLTPEKITNQIHVIRGSRVMPDSDLADLYEITTGNLNKAVKRNFERFPEDFMFQLTDSEWENLNFHFGISSSRHGGRRVNPYVFTEQGVAMLSSVLRSEKAIKVNIQIMRVFVQMRQLLSEHQEMAQKLTELESRADKTDKSILEIIAALRQLMSATPDDAQKRQVGFV